MVFGESLSRMASRSSIWRSWTSSPADYETSLHKFPWLSQDAAERGMSEHERLRPSSDDEQESCGPRPEEEQESGHSRPGSSTPIRRHMPFDESGEASDYTPCPSYPGDEPGESFKIRMHQRVQIDYEPGEASHSPLARPDPRYVRDSRNRRYEAIIPEYIEHEYPGHTPDEPVSPQSPAEKQAGFCAAVANTDGADGTVDANANIAGNNTEPAQDPNLVRPLF